MNNNINYKCSIYIPFSVAPFFGYFSIKGQKKIKGKNQFKANTRTKTKRREIKLAEQLEIGLLFKRL